MSIPQPIEDFLVANDIGFLHYPHEPEPTAAKTAERLHIKESDFGKCIVIVAGGDLALAVIPVNEQLDTDAVAEALEARGARLATEREVDTAFPDCEPGAVPPLGSLFGVPVLIDFAFEDHRLLSFKAGTHTDVIQVCLDDFVKAVHPIACRLTAAPGTTGAESRRATRASRLPPAAP